MDKKGKSVIIFGLTVVLALTIFAVIGIAHLNPQGKQTHPQGLDTESCQDALTGAEEQLTDRGTINPRLLNNTEDKCGVGECRIEFDAANEPILVCGEASCITRTECGVIGGAIVETELCKSGLACGIAATFDCICPIPI
ncbi:MAG: hypothetical protein IH934_04915 [Nanoarchaeota archaeon]|nr:hypothetical protein [Nanoarchaeota archaeon]